MNVILFDGTGHDSLLPLTYTRPVADLRIGILTIKEKWELYYNNVSFLTRDYLNKKYTTNFDSDNIYIYGGLCPDAEVLKEIQQLGINEILKDEEDNILAFRSTQKLKDLDNLEPDIEKTITTGTIVQYTWDIFSKNEQEIAADFQALTDGKKSAEINSTNTVVEPDRVFIEKGADVSCSILNPDGGYIYIGKNASVMEGSIIRGSFALCEGASLKLGAKIYGPTTIGPHSKVGGEVNNSVIQGYSNKGHDGFIGNTVIGHWCNLGADTNTSNLKNNYANVRLWDYESGRFKDTGLQFCGLVMGDHSKCGINTMFNTGTVVGVSANIYGAGFPRNFIPSFSWGGASGNVTFKLNKVFEVAEKVMARRNLDLNDLEKDILEQIFEKTAQFRKWEN